MRDAPACSSHACPRRAHHEPHRKHSTRTSSRGGPPCACVTRDGVRVETLAGRTILRVAPEALRQLAREAFARGELPPPRRQLGAMGRRARRPGRGGQRPLRGRRAVEECGHCRRRRAAALPGHRHRLGFRHARASRSSPAATTPPSLPPGRPTPMPAATSDTRNWPRCRCARSATRARTCRRRSTSTPPPASNTASSSSPRGAARRTRPPSSRRPRPCSTTPRWTPFSASRCGRWASPPARPTTWPWSSAAPAPSST